MLTKNYQNRLMYVKVIAYINRKFLDIVYTETNYKTYSNQAGRELCLRQASKSNVFGLV